MACFCLFTSCDWFTSNEEKTQELVNEEMRNINFNEVDRYPLFDDCDEMMDKSGQLDCFQNTLLSQYTETLEDFEFQFVSDIDTTIYVDFMVDFNGEISVLEVQRNEDIEKSNSRISKYHHPKSYRPASVVARPKTRGARILKI